MTIRFQDLARLHESIKDDLDVVIRDVISRSAFVACPVEFEIEFAAATGSTAAAGCNSGTDALSLAMRALGIGYDDEVIVPSMTFFATAEAVIQAGAIPVIVDVDHESLLLDPDEVESALTDRTKAVIPVHLYGAMSPPEHLRGWRKAGMLVIEDAAQGHLAHRGGVRVGEVGHAACYSFYPGKNLGAFGDAGAVTSDDTDLVDRVRFLRDHGRSSKYVHAEVGVSSRMDGIQAAVLRAKLCHLAGWTERRQALAAQYCDELADAPNVRVVSVHEGHVHHLFVIELTTAEQRDVTRERLREAGIGCGVHYPIALHEQPALAPYLRSDCPVARDAGRRVLSLPMDPLMSDREVSMVVEHVVASVRLGNEGS